MAESTPLPWHISLPEYLASSDSGVKVKPLVWRDHRPDSFPEPAWSAQTPFGFYNIEEVSASDSPAYVVRLHAHHFIADKDSLEEAKAAAQADYEQRVGSVLQEGRGRPMTTWQDIGTAPRDRPTAALAKAWMPIESAPRDRAVLVAAYIVPSAEAQRNGSQPAWHIDVGRAFGTNLDRWTNVLGEKPSRWMPLPEPPK